VWEGAGPASVAISRWAGVSKHPSVDVAAQAEVLAAVRDFPRQPAAADGNPVVTVAEIKKALSASKPCTTPGLDGLPVVFYKYCQDVMLPLLARLYTA